MFPLRQQIRLMGLAVVLASLCALLPTTSFAQTTLLVKQEGVPTTGSTSSTGYSGYSTNYGPHTHFRFVLGVFTVPCFHGGLIDNPIGSFVFTGVSMSGSGHSGNLLRVGLYASLYSYQVGWRFEHNGRYLKGGVIHGLKHKPFKIVCGDSISIELSSGPRATYNIVAFNPKTNIAHGVATGVIQVSPNTQDVSWETARYGCLTLPNTPPSVLPNFGRITWPQLSAIIAPSNTPVSLTRLNRLNVTMVDREHQVLATSSFVGAPNDFTTTWVAPGTDGSLC